MEVSLHSHIGQHPNIIVWFATGDNAIWKWIAMEYAWAAIYSTKLRQTWESAKILRISNFSQLISGVSFMHSKAWDTAILSPRTSFFPKAAT